MYTNLISSRIAIYSHWQQDAVKPSFLQRPTYFKFNDQQGSREQIMYRSPQSPNTETSKGQNHLPFSVCYVASVCTEAYIWSHKWLSRRCSLLSRLPEVLKTLMGRTIANGGESVRNSCYAPDALNPISSGSGRWEGSVSSELIVEPHHEQTCAAAKKQDPRSTESSDKIEFQDPRSAGSRVKNAKSGSSIPEIRRDNKNSGPKISKIPRGSKNSGAEVSKLLRHNKNSGSKISRISQHNKNSGSKISKISRHKKSGSRIYRISWHKNKIQDLQDPIMKNQNQQCEISDCKSTIFFKISTFQKETKLCGDTAIMGG